jgi:hypothetical protein
MATLDFDQQTEDLIDVDDKVVVLVRWVGRGKASGAQGEISMAMVWTVREQAITRVEFFLDRRPGPGSRRAAGLAAPASDEGEYARNGRAPP